MPELNNTVLKNLSTLKAYYRLESGALTTDSSGNNYTLTNNNTVGSGTGVFGGSADFGTGNTNKTLRVSNNLGIAGLGDLSIVGWFRMNAEIASGQQTFCGHASTTTNDNYCSITYQYNSGTRRIGIKGGYGVSAFYNVALGTTWHHIAMTRSGTTYRLYLDGNHVSTATITAAALGANAFAIGDSGEGSNEFASIVADDVAVFGATLSADQVKEIYEGRFLGELHPEPATFTAATRELATTSLASSANLKAYYKFESGALTTDNSGNSHTLTAISDPAEGTGKFGGGVDLDGNDAYSAVDHADFKPTGVFSVGAWIKTSNADQMIFQSFSQNTAWAGIFFYLSATTGYLVLASGRNTGTTQSTNWQQVVGTTSLKDGAWHHVAGVWDGSYLRIYVDGRHENSIAWANAPAYAATNYVRVGCYNTAGSNSLFFTGSIDDLFLLNGTALTPDQIDELYQLRGGLVGLWHLNGGSTDSSGNNNHGTDTAVTYSLTNGKFNQGAGFNGSSSRADMGNAAALKITGPQTWMCWFKTLANANNTMYTILGMDKLSSRGRKIYLYNNTIYWYENSLTTNEQVGSSVAISTSTWYHVATTYDGSTITIYVNGKPTSLPASGSSPNTTASFIIGADQTGGSDAVTNFLNGTIDEVSVWNRPLTASEIRKIYALQTGKLQ